MKTRVIFIQIHATLQKPPSTRPDSERAHGRVRVRARVHASYDHGGPGFLSIGLALDPLQRIRFVRFVEHLDKPAPTRQSQVTHAPTVTRRRPRSVYQSTHPALCVCLSVCVPVLGLGSKWEFPVFIASLCSALSLSLSRARSLSLSLVVASTCVITAGAWYFQSRPEPFSRHSRPFFAHPS